MSARERAALGGLLVLALALRLPAVRQNLFGDELFAFYEVHGRDLGGVFDALLAPPRQFATELSPPLFFVAAWASQHLGADPVWIRLPSLLAGTGLVAVMWALGRRAAGPAAGLLCAAMVTLSPFAIFYSGEGRPYATMTLLLALSTLGAVEALRGGGRGWWALYAVAAVGALYTHYTAIFVVVAQALWVLWRRRAQLPGALALHGAMVVAYLPWLPFLVRKGLVGVDIGRPVTSRSVVSTVAHVLPGQPFVSLALVPGRPALVALAAAAGLVALAAWRRGARPHPGATLSLAALLVPATLAGLLAYNLLAGASLLSPRNLSASFPAALVVLGAAVVTARGRTAWAAAALVLAALGAGAARSVLDERAEVRNSANRDVAGYLDAAAQPGEPVVAVTVEPPSSPLGRSLLIYLRRAHPYYNAAVSEPAWRHLRRGGRLFLVYPAVPPLSALRPGATPARHPEARVLAVRVFADRVPTAVAVLGPRPSGARAG